MFGFGYIVVTKQNMNLIDHLKAAQKHAADHPSPAVAGAVNVLPLFDDKGRCVELQFNGFSIRLWIPQNVWHLNTYGSWSHVETAKIEAEKTQPKHDEK